MRIGRRGRDGRAAPSPSPSAASGDGRNAYGLRTPLPPLQGGDGSRAAPEFSNPRAQDSALGGAPHYAGDELLAARFADCHLYDRALANEEIRRSAH